jgi:hypothetical protein
VFIGHFAISFAATRVAPGLALGTLFVASQLADLLWPNLLLANVESVAISPGITAVTPLDFISYPYSHSLLMLAVWGTGAALICYGVTRNVTHAVTLAAVVLSHWLLDFVTHRPDMPLAFGDTRVGLGLWNSIPATIAVEGLMFIVGVLIYMRTTRARDRVGNAALWALVVLLVLIYLANVLGPPPPSVGAVAWSVQAMWLLVLWAYWIDRHRAPVAPVAPDRT